MNDLKKLAFPLLVETPGFAAVAVLGLAGHCGKQRDLHCANAVVLAPLPFRHPDLVVRERDDRVY